MRQIEIPLATILPIQRVGVWRSGVDMYLAQIDQGEELPPIDLVALPDMPGHHILLHGHHRGRAAYELGHSVIAANLTESDGDIQTDQWSELRWLYPGLKTIKDIVNRFHTYWQPRVRSSGFSGLHDMPIINPSDLKEESKPPPGMSFQEYAKWERGY